MLLAYPSGVLTTGYIQAPVQAVLDVPLAANRLQFSCLSLAKVLLYSRGMELASEMASGKAQSYSNSWLLRGFTTPQGVFFYGQVRTYELTVLP